jgi:N6-adenosine-specific RNA methylase IME4
VNKGRASERPAEGLRGKATIQQLTGPFDGLRLHSYRVILADPPWKFSAGPGRNPKNHYRIMALAEIAALPVGELAHPDGCRLVLWVPFRSLHQALPVIAAWGFKYCTARPWLKLWPREDGLILYPDSFAKGTGYEIANSSELQIIAKRGRPRLNGTLLRGHIIAPRREHSRKPNCVRVELAELFDGPRCELFARSHHPAFDCWGDEVGSSIPQSIRTNPLPPEITRSARRRRLATNRRRANQFSTRWRPRWPIRSYGLSTLKSTPKTTRLLRR